MQLGNMRTYQHMRTHQHVHIRYEHMRIPPIFKACGVIQAEAPFGHIALAVFVVCLTTFNVYEQT